MESCNCRDLASPHASKRLQNLLDKLVAVRMDLERTRRTGTADASVVVSLELITGACEILRSAAVDVRNIIHQNDGYGESTPLAAYLSTCEPESETSLQG
jgi:hypothetical protein